MPGVSECPPAEEAHGAKQAVAPAIANLVAASAAALMRGISPGGRRRPFVVSLTSGLTCVSAKVPRIVEPRRAQLPAAPRAVGTRMVEVEVETSPRRSRRWWSGGRTCGDKVEQVDYKDVTNGLKKYVSDRSNIRSRRITGRRLQGLPA